ncbi:hypothetical protein LSAT2_032459, partial [Lamellibrachia satsuma]
MSRIYDTATLLHHQSAGNLSSCSNNRPRLCGALFVDTRVKYPRNIDISIERGATIIKYVFAISDCLTACIS